MKKLLAVLALAALVASPALANEPAKSMESNKSIESSKSAPAASASAPSAAPATATASGTTATTSTTTTTTQKTETAVKAETVKAELPAGLKKATGSKGEFFTTASGMTVYTYGKDVAGKSNCTAECAKIWPAVTVSSSEKPAAPFSVINGSQLAFNGSPLYTYSMDKKAGETNGSSIPGWSIALAAPVAPAQKPAH